MNETRLRRMIRNILLEVSDDSHGDPAYKNYYDEDDDGNYSPGEDIPMGLCPIDEEGNVGGTHYFHGNKMYPCGGEGVGKYKDMGNPDGNLGSEAANGGPFLGHGVVDPDELRIADEYIEKFSPSTLVAYSRGAAVANDMSSNVSDTVYLAPAWGRKYGASVESITNPGKGRVFHGGADNFVPVANSVQACINTGMAFYAKPDRNHGSIVGDFKKGRIGTYTKIPGKQLDALLKELPTWGSEEYLDSEDPKVKEQNEIIRKYIEGLKESAVRKVVRSILLEKKAKKKKKRKVKCPLLPGGKRDYKCEYRKYGGASKKGKKDRAARNKARRQAIRMGLVKKGDGMEIDHIMPLSLGGSNDPKNWQVMTRAENRKKGKSWDGKQGHMDETQKKGKSKKKSKKGKKN